MPQIEFVLNLKRKCLQSNKSYLAENSKDIMYFFA